MDGNCFIQSLFSVVNKSLKIFFLIMIFSGLIFSQETNKDQYPLSDSIKINVRINPLTNLQIKFDEFEIYRELNSVKMNIDIAGDPNTLWLRTSLAVSNTNNSNAEFKPNFLSPLERKYHEDSKFDPIRYVLGAAQVGAVGYLAYKHIKKYGFLK